jgi:hypothetical protein
MQSAWSVLYCQLFPYLAVPYFSTLSYKGRDCRKKFVENKIFILISSTKFSETVLTLRRIKRDINISVNTSLCKVLVICVRLLSKLVFSADFRKNHQILNCNKIRPVGADLFSVD